MADIFEIAGRIHSTSREEVAAVANEILDTVKNKKQDEINTETYTLVNDINERLSGLSPDQQSALSVAAKATNNEIKLGYYVCGTEGNAAAKVISNATGYVLSTGGSIKIKMTNANTANNATLNINSTGAKPLYYDGVRASANNTWEASETVEVYYDGTNFYANNVAGGGGDGVFDVSEKYPTSGVEGGNTYTLQGALTVLNANLPASKKKGGMSIKFIQSSDNKYVQFRYMGTSISAADFTNVANWQGIESNPTYSSNLVDGRGIVSHLEHFELTGKGNNGVSVHLEYIIPGKTYVLSMDKTWLKPTDALAYFQIYYRPINGEAIELVNVSSYDVIPSLLCKEYVLTIPQDAGAGRLQVWCKIPQDVTIKFSIKERADITPKEYGTNLVEEGSVKRVENLLNGITQEKNYLTNAYISSQGEITNETGSSCVSDKFDVEEGDEVLLYVDSAINAHRLAFYDSSDNPLSITENVEGGVMATAPVNTSYMRFSFPITSVGKAYALVTNKNKRYIPLDGMLSVDDRAEVIVDNALHTSTNVVVQRYSVRDFLISSNNKYEVNSNVGSIFIPVHTGERYKVTANANYGTILAFLTDRQYTNGETAHFCTAYPERIVLSKDKGGEYVIPNDCLYMAVYVKNGSGNNTTPIIELIEEKYLEENEEQAKFVIPYSDCKSSYQSYYLASTETWTSYTGRGCLLVDIPNNVTDIIVNADANINIAFFTTSTIDFNTAPPYADNSIRNIIWQGENVKIKVPTGAKILYVYMPTADAHYNISFLVPSELEEVLDDSTYGDFTEIDTAQATVYNNIFIGSGSYPDRWNTISGRKIGFIAIPDNSKYLKITPQLNNSVLFLLKNNKTPANNVVAELSEGYKSRIILPVGSSYILPLLPDCRYVAFSMNNGSSNIITPNLFVASKATEAADKIIEDKCEYFIGGEILDVEFNDTPDVLFSNKDTGLPTTEDKSLSWYSVVKISENLYYMYYNPLGTADQSGDQYFHLAFAWSTDGLNWNKSIPSGITPPVPGTNLLFEQHAFGMDVVIVQDNAYPFRMVAFDWHASSAMYKSADGINWTKIREYPYYYDTQASVIVRGNTLKIYLRRRDGEGRLDRYIGIVTTDLDGNVLTPPTIFFGKYYYQASASAIDWRREIMFPTFFNPTDNTQHLECFIVDENKIYPRNVDFSNIISASDLSMYVAPKIINIGNDFYIYYCVRNTPHDGATNPTMTYKRAKITFKNTGYWWYPQP